MTRALLAALALLAVACGGGGHRRPPAAGPTPRPSQPPAHAYTAPPEFLASITDMRLRLAPGSYTVKLAPSVEPYRAYLFAELAKTSALTGGAVVYVPDDGRGHDFEVGISADDPAIRSPQGVLFAGVNVYNVRGHVITGGRILFSDPRWVEDVGIVGHELGHTTGLGHVADHEGTRFRMGNCSGIAEYHPWEREGWLRLQEMVLPASGGEQREVVIACGGSR